MIQRRFPVVNAVKPANPELSLNSQTPNQDSNRKAIEGELLGLPQSVSYGSY